MKNLPLISLASFGCAVAVQAQTIPWTGLAENGLWSDPGNWTDGNVPDTNLETAQYGLAADVSINVNQNFTIKNIIDGFAGPGFTTTVGGAGTLTIDVNSAAATTVGLDNATGPTGGTLVFTGSVTINNSGQDAAGDVTIIRNTNSPDNILRFGTTSVLTLQTAARTNATATAPGSLIEFNGTLAASAADLQIASNNVSIGAGHNSTGFGRDIVLNASSKLAVDGGTVLNTGRKFQVNGSGAELELNGANAINGANINVGSTHSFLIDVNADQANMGILNDIGGILTIDLDPTVTLLSFLDSSGSAANWTGGTVVITGFREGVIRFGTDANGLTPEQLALIDGGIYGLTSTGFLTTGADVTAPIGVDVAVSGLDMELTFDSVAGTTYTLYKSSNLGAAFPAGWTPVTSQAASGGPLTLVDAGGKPAAGASIFYRIEATPTP